MTTPTPRTARSGLVALTAAVLVTAALTEPARASGAPDDHRRTERAMAETVANGAPGVTAQVRDRAGDWQAAVGVGDLRTGRPRDADDRYRIGSVTKTFVATVLLALEAEGRIDLDDTVERWLPDLVRGGGHDGRQITVRQLLNHTSGVRNYTADPEFRRWHFQDPGFSTHRFDTLAPRALVRTALSGPAAFAPGATWGYSNTNYVLAGLVIEAVTGRPYGEAVRDRIIRPLGLRATSVPGTDPHVPGPSGRGYGRLSDHPGATSVHDVTLLNPSMAYAAGEMISSSADLTRFFAALLHGDLLPARQLAAMTTTVPTGLPSRSRYGLGIASVPTGCGLWLWGHGGGIPGSSTRTLSTRDGGHALAYNLNADWLGGGAIEEAEFCGGGGGGGGDRSRSRGPGQRGNTTT
ncbi:serine hydrolase [Streptomyces sp. NPDC005955]|uniref:serine hydrolase domain-containing protein n=1 Tax=Streptomyces sp. NPDC005955 TaxID=3364738 RepID=UPI003677790A